MKTISLFYFILCVAVRFACTAELCTLPGGGTGKCISINNCPILSLAKTNNNIADYKRNIRCGSHDENKVSSGSVKFYTCLNGFEVCCGPPPSVPERGNCKNQITAFPPNPETECCGIQASGQNRIVGGTSTGIDQYPWLALLEYKIGNQISLKCEGALISNKYVLTAAHCMRSNKPVSVRLGEYDITHDGRDCLTSSTDCTDPAVSIPIKEILIHPEYDHPLKRNDIALIRLDGVANYTDFIRPICLTTLDVSQLSPNVSLYVAGWGRISWNLKYSRLKQHVKLPMVNMQDCLNAYHIRAGEKIQLWSKQLCAGGEYGRDACNGDSGGPLMMETLLPNNLTVITEEGIVSYGLQECGTKDVPGVYTKVYEYNTWIRRHIRP
ncbi:unnamed protein product [Diatraea saccharalis]|uniref:CLIP domain-containing serine protease n=1 Tax=Diatraea saccharalis TaxID=40085 RepID=A0A9N9RA07_9NEOP|nr:unnamed protein product [Diatraea saccharalis]